MILFIVVIKDMKYLGRNRVKRIRKIFLMKIIKFY